jgi:SRSO17 transposase
LLVEWPRTEKEPTKYFLCDLPAHYTLRRVVRIAKSRWQIEQDYQQLKEKLGLDHYEGLSWTSWHHHVTLVMLAHAFLTLEKLRSKKTSGWTLLQTRREIQRVLFTWTGYCAYCGSEIRRSNRSP